MSLSLSVILTPRLPRTRAFTLVELLTVIAILGILGAILIPVIGSMRQRARATECASNLRQIGVAMALHANDNRRLLPKMINRDGQTPSTTWIQKLAPYVGMEDRIGSAADGKARAAGVFLCPSYDYDPATRFVSYAMNIYIDPVTQSPWNYQLSIPSPAQTFLIVETGGRNDDSHSPNNNGDVARRHPGSSANFLFVDGHVEALSTPRPLTSAHPGWNPYP